MMMKKRVIIFVLVGAMFAEGILISTAFAAKGKCPSMEDRQKIIEMRYEKYLEIMTELLNLTEAQQEQIRALHEQERARLEPYRQQMSEGNEKLRELLEGDTFDEAAIRGLAANQANIRIEMMVSRARMRHQVFALLNPDQQALAKKLQPLLHKPEGLPPEMMEH